MPPHGRAGASPRSRDEKIVFMYSGQGSHYYQAGRDLFERDGAFRRYALEVDALMQDELGVSIVAELYDSRKKPSDRFDRTLRTHCAIFLVESALGKALRSDGVAPDFLMATSMGTFAALEFAQCLTLREAVRAVIEQARLLESLCPRGAMLAVPNMKPDAVAALAERFDCEVGAINDWSPCTLAGRLDRIDALEAALRADGALVQRLAVSHAFHSRWIDAAREPFLTAMGSARVGRPTIPIVCCASVALLHDIDETYLWDVIRKPIRFDAAATMFCTKQSGTLRFIDVGPAGTLATSLKYGKARLGAACEIDAVLSPFGGGAGRYERIVADFEPATPLSSFPEPIAW